MKLQNLSKSICKNTVFKYLLDKCEDGDVNNGIPNINRYVNYNVYNNLHRNNNRINRNNANFHHGIYQGWRTARMGVVSRWNV